MPELRKLRIQSLIDLDLLNSAPEEELNQVVRLATEICSTPMGLITLIGDQGPLFKAIVGITAQDSPKENPFSTCAMALSDLLIVEDALKDERFQTSSLVQGRTKVRFYAGLSLHAPNGVAVGSMCVLDTVPRQMTDGQKNALRILARQIQVRFELRAKQKALEAALAEYSRITDKLEESQNLLHTFLDNGPFAAYVKDESGRYLFHNKVAFDCMGLEGQGCVGRSDDEIFPPEIAGRLRQHDQAVIAGGEPIELIEETLGAGHSRNYWKSFKFPFKRASGEAVLAGLSVNITTDLERERALEESLRQNAELMRNLESSEALFRAFMDFIPMYALIKSADGKYVFYNRHMANAMGIDQKVWIGKTDFDVLSPSLAARLCEVDLEVLREDKMVESFNEVPGGSGVSRKLRGLTFSYRNVSGEPMIASVAIDMTELADYKEKLEVANRKLVLIATTDPLTGLQNRRAFWERLNAEFQLYHRTGRHMSVVVLDIDDFKNRNDQLGHAAGDEALQVVGQTLASICRAGDLAARIGGEEFAVILPETSHFEANHLAARIHDSLRAVELGFLPLTVSVGIASIQPHTADSDSLLAYADEAMYCAKTTGKDRTVIYHPSGTETSPSVPQRLESPTQREMENSRLPEIPVLYHFPGTRR
jgi:diguanylate cyclase (GGDEF)-like protein/PAS domain S-box-containing protein